MHICWNVQLKSSVKKRKMWYGHNIFRENIAVWTGTWKDLVPKLLFIKWFALSLQHPVKISQLLRYRSVFATSYLIHPRNSGFCLLPRYARRCFCGNALTCMVRFQVPSYWRAFALHKREQQGDYSSRNLKIQDISAVIWYLCPLK